MEVSWPYCHNNSTFIQAMFRKILCTKKPKPCLRAPAENQWSAALKIIHPGGIVEHYYMATPAARIMDKYPAFILASPDVFRRPWESIVKRDEILIPGQKYYVVPKQTVKKLRRRIRRHSVIISNVSFVSQSSNDAAAAAAAANSNARGIPVKPPTGKSRTKTKAKNRRVRFFGVNNAKHKGFDSDSSSSECMKAGEKDNDDIGNGLKSRPSLDGKRRAARHTTPTWQPSLTVITETFGQDE